MECKSEQSIINPWNAQHNLRTLIDHNVVLDVSKLSLDNLIKHFGNLYVMTINDVCERDFFMNKKLDTEQYDYMKNKMIMRHIPFSVLKNDMMLTYLTIVSGDDLPTHYINYKGQKMEFDGTNVLVISMLNMSNIGIDNFLKQYYGLSSLNDLIQMFLVNNYFQKDIFGSNNKLIRSQMINNMTESNYWCIINNCKLNITLKFLSRGFTLSLNNRLENKEVKQILSKIMTKSEEDHDYLNHIFKKQTYVDASSMIEKEGYRLYRISRMEDMILKEDFNNILDGSINKQELYLLLCNMLLSKEYCHLIVNNANALEKLTDTKIFNEKRPLNEQRSLLQKYTPLFAHLWSYAWLSMYLEESIKRTRIEQTDRFVFDLETASKLPYFPMTPDEPMGCPYLPLMVNSDVLLSRENNIGVGNFMLKNKSLIQGVASPDEFMKRLNMFVSGSHNKNYLENINWNSIAISGSVMAACLPRFNPLMLNFYDDNNINYIEYFNEYYKEADIDVMCNGEKFEFIDKVHEFANKMKENIVKSNNIKNNNMIVNISYVKTCAVMVNKEFIIKYILPGTKLSYVDVALHLHEMKIKSLFYEWYIKQKLIDNKTYLDSSEYFDNRYNSYFELCNVEDLLIVITKKREDYQYPNKKPSPIIQRTESKRDVVNNESSDNEDDIDDVNTLKKEINNILENDEEKEEENDEEKGEENDEGSFLLKDESEVITEEVKEIKIPTDEECMFSVNENLKFRISSQYLPHNFELFRIKFPSFFSTVARFHLPIVRAYYNGNKTYLLPSCISACMTMMNIDYKYFAGAKDPIEIINKYRMRGFGTYLNGKEKIRMLDYSSQINKWNKLYDVINVKSPNSTKKVFGKRELTCSLFRPNKVLFNKEISYTSCNYTRNEISKYSLNTSYCELYEGDYNNITGPQELIHNTSCINRNGYVLPFKKWLISGCYDYPIKPLNNT